MKANDKSGATQVRNVKRGNCLAISRLAFAIAGALPLTSFAAVYIVNNESDLQLAIHTANLNSDANAVIQLNGNVVLSALALSEAPAQGMTIDTQGFTLTGASADSSTAGALAFLNVQGPLTLSGTFAGGNANTGSSNPAESGIATSSGTVASSIINNGSITGGASGGGPGAGGAGASLNMTTFANHASGIISGGLGVGTSLGGIGAFLRRGTTLTNSGVVEGGDSENGGGGTGIDVGGPGASNQLINHGTIRGGTSLDGSAAGGVGVNVRAGTLPIINTGTIEGGNGSRALTSNVDFSLTNSGIIRAGADQGEAIRMLLPTKVLTLELQAGSDITGIVFAGILAPTDTLRLGGSADAMFDASSIGDADRYQNFDIFQKTGASTWTLTGAGTGVTPWDIQQGTLRIDSDAALGDSTGALTFSGGALSSSADVTLARAVTFNTTGTFLPDANTTLTLDSVLTGAGGLTQAGAGTLVIPDAKTYTGPTTVDAGTLAVNGSITSPVMVNAAGTLGGVGTIHGDVTNAGTVAPGNLIGTLTVNGNYIGQGGTLAIEANLDGDASAADRLIVTGDTSGTTNVKVTKVGGTGVQTIDGIKIIDVQGASNGAFNLVGDYVFQGQQAVVSGAYAYRLYKNGVATPADGGWYLRSDSTQPPDTNTPPPTDPAGNPLPPTQPLYAPSVPLYEAYAGVLQQFNQLGTLRQRVGDRAWASDKSVKEGSGAWARVESQHSDISPDRTTTGTHYDATTQKLQVGLDMMLGGTESGSWVAGLTGQYGRIDSNVSSLFGLGRIKTHGHGFGGTLTWYGSNGIYVDAQAEYNWYRTDLSSRTLGHMLVDDNKGTGYGAGVEAGWKFPFSTGWSLTPQAQLTYSSVRFDGFGDQYGAQVSRKDSDAMTARAGLALDRETSWQSASGKASRAHVYGIANLYYDFLDGSKVDVSGSRLTSKNQPLWGGLGVGGSLTWSDDRYSLYGEATANSSLRDFRDSQSVGVKVGFSMKW
ncbi:autotransporter outer membrane beta-barrel domain-containing protein [Luteibacter sp.]|jgi:fibronectin-binding autotransporter adhesin|uniref:autotransporter family protein n=1 Tax=Luteibacter sp. TaxID=1886636 RepID=UPI002F3FE305